MLDEIRIVLCHTSHPGNIGAAARAMKTMGLSRLALVAPKAFPSAEATARASGADDLLAAARCFGELEQALADCRFVLGTSARLRRIPMPAIDAREGAGRAMAEAAKGPVAIVFGREQSGLSNEEIDRCHALVHIPANPEFSSLNLASTVQVIGYELRMAALAAESIPTVADDQDSPAPQERLEGLVEHLRQTLVDIRFLHPTQQVSMMARLRRLFARARPSETEINILRGILSAAQKAAKAKKDGPP